MDKDIEILRNQWHAGRYDNACELPELHFIFRQIRKRERENFVFYYGTVCILSLTLLVLLLFFRFAVPLRDKLSCVGSLLMLSGLALRILIELVSIVKARRISSADSTLVMLDRSVWFHRFRKWIHRIISPIILGVYTLGFYMISPEFSCYLPVSLAVLFNLSYVAVGATLFCFIRKRVRREMYLLEALSKLRFDVACR